MPWPARAADEVIPPAPARHFNDYAGMVRSSTVSELDMALENFERQSSSQVVVAIFPRMQSSSSIEDYTVRVAQAWRVGQEKQDNGVVLFVFRDDRKAYMQVGYGLEGAIPDITAKRIIDGEITARFRNGDFDGGMRAGVHAIMAAARGEYQGSGQTQADAQRREMPFWAEVLLILFVLWLIRHIVFRMSGNGMRGTVYGSSGRWDTGGRSSGGRSRGGGGFRGGGGSFGGGGAGGSW